MPAWLHGKGKKSKKEKKMKKSAEQEGQGRMMSFAMGIKRRCDEAQIDYSQLAKAAGVRPEMLAPALVDVMIQASEKPAK